MAKVDLPFDPSQEEVGEITVKLPDGDYLVDIVGVNYKPSQDGKAPSMMIECKVAASAYPALVGGKVSPQFVQFPNMTDAQIDASFHIDNKDNMKTAMRIRRQEIASIMKAAGHPMDQQLDTDLLIGKRVGVRVKTEDAKPERYDQVTGKTYKARPETNKVVRWFSPKEYRAGTPAAAPQGRPTPRGATVERIAPPMLPPPVQAPPAGVIGPDEFPDGEPDIG